MFSHKFREKYSRVIYHSYNFSIEEDYLSVVFDFEIEGLSHFYHKLKFPIKHKPYKVSLEHPILKRLLFCLGMIELISYWKLTASPIILIKASRLNKEEIDFFKTIYFKGLGEYFYLNKLDLTYDNFVTFDFITREDKNFLSTLGCPCCRHLLDLDSKALLPLGGGKDSLLSLEILKTANIDFDYLVINPNYTLNITISKNKTKNNKKESLIKRELDVKLLEYNKQVFLNGHIPFSAVVAFVSLIQAYIYNYKWIVLSNESSANESTVHDKDINHQWSKSYEFELLFQNFIKKQLGLDFRYFSLLRPFSEFKIVKCFSKFPQHFSYFKSCNLGSKTSIWCENCAKCLFIYLMLAVFLPSSTLNTDIFKSNLLENKNFKKDFLSLLGFTEHKPFECVGEVSEVRLAVEKVYQKYLKDMKEGKCQMPFLLKVYQEEVRPRLDISQILSTEDQILTLNKKIIDLMPSIFINPLLDFDKK